MKENPIVQYMTDQEIGTVEMAGLLKVSKGYVSQLKAGDKPITPRVARRMGEITGKPWWKFMPEVAGA